MSRCPTTNGAAARGSPTTNKGDQGTVHRRCRDFPDGARRLRHIKYGNLRLKDARVIGTTRPPSPVHDVYVEGPVPFGDGRQSRQSVVVIGSEVADSLSVRGSHRQGDHDRHPQVRVIGVMEKKGKSSSRTATTSWLLPLGVTGSETPRFSFLLADVKPVSNPRWSSRSTGPRHAAPRKEAAFPPEGQLRHLHPGHPHGSLRRHMTQGIYLVMIAISSIGRLGAASAS